MLKIEDTKTNFISEFYVKLSNYLKLSLSENLNIEVEEYKLSKNDKLEIKKIQEKFYLM